MRYEAFILPGAGSSDALMDWFERQEIVPLTRDVRRDESAAAEALALGGGTLPVVRVGERVVSGYDPVALAGLEVAERPGDFDVVTDPEGRLVVERVAPGSVAHGVGLREGDVIAELAGYRVFSPEQFKQALTPGRRGRVTIRVRRGEDVLTLAYRPASAI